MVGDVGSYSCKMGFAGEDFPKAYFTSVRKEKEALNLCSLFIVPSRLYGLQQHDVEDFLKL